VILWIPTLHVCYCLSPCLFVVDYFVLGDAGGRGRMSEIYSLQDVRSLHHLRVSVHHEHIIERETIGVENGDVGIDVRFLLLLGVYMTCQVGRDGITEQSISVVSSVCHHDHIKRNWIGPLSSVSSQ